MTTPEQRVIEVDGATLEVWLAGVDDPVVCQSHAFSARGPDLASGAHPPWPWDGSIGSLVGVNPRGVGHSSVGRSPHDFTFRQQVDDLEAVRQLLGVERWVFWGSSGGGAIALLYALAHPQSLSGLIIAKCGPNGQRVGEDARSNLSPLNPQYQEDRALLAAGTSLERRPAVLGSVEPRLAPAEWVRMQGDRWVLRQKDHPLVICPTGQERVLAAFEQFVTVFNVQDRLGEIQIPTLVVASGQDESFPISHLELLRTGIRDAEFVVLEESGHSDPALESADGEKYRAAVRTFLDRLPM